MLRLRKIAITGGIASGKSAVRQIFRKLGAFVVDADAIVHELLTPDTTTGQQVIRLLGTEILQKGKLSRRLIADKVFNNSETLHALEQIVHPAVLKRIDELYAFACSEGIYKAFVAEIPLLYEIEAEKYYDTVIAVVAREDLIRQRISEEEFLRRMKHQIEPEEKAKRADFVICNEGTIDELRKQVMKISKEVFSP